MGDREKNIARPFYELPAHIKPCSRIIQETRMQLKYTKKIGSELSSVPSAGGPSGDFVGNDYFGNCDLPEIEYRGMSPSGFGGMRPVNTQRPFTPRDSVSIWGVSARKRPPSAITLSRLSIEELDESRPNSSSFPNGRIFSGRLKPLVPISSLSGLPSHVTSLLSETLSSDDPLEPTDNTYSSAEECGVDVENARLKIKTMSLHNVTYPRTGQPMQPALWLKEDDECKMTGKKSKLSSTNTDNATDKKTFKPTNGFENSKNTNAATKKIVIKAAKEINVDHYREINNLEVAVEYLRCFVIESGTSDKPPKSDVLSILKKIRDHISDVNVIPQLKNKLLKLIFKLVERSQNDEDILFWASFVLLHCNIIGNNLTTVFKLVFKASRSKGYWDIIKDTEYLNVLMESFGHICPKSQTESMIYGYGTLKFICSDDIVLNRVIQLDLISIMALHLKILNCEVVEMGKVPEAIFNGVFQLTSILRSVVGEDGSLISVAQSGLMEELCCTLVWTFEDIDVLTNIVRILSVVSMDDMCCQIILNNEQFCEAVVKVLKIWYAKDDVMVRLTYVIGTLLADSDDMRIKLFEEPYAFRSILQIISHYTEKSTPISMDILVKTTRILANWILNPTVGYEICEDPELSELMYSTLQIKDISDELILCVMCTLNNTSYYKNTYDLDEGTMKTVEYLYRNLNMKDLDARTEAVKVLGNLTRNELIRSVASEYVDNILLSLEEDPEELLCATCGVLINVIIEEKVKIEFLRSNGVASVIRVLGRKDDPILNLMATQMIWNLLISNENQGYDNTNTISEHEKKELKRILNEKLQKPPVHIDMSDPMTAHLQDDDFEQDFHSVAKHLIQKL